MPDEPPVENFTEIARQAIIQAEAEARRAGQHSIGTEQILLGIIHFDESTGAKSLKTLGVSLRDVHNEINNFIDHGHEKPFGKLPFTPRASNVLRLSEHEAVELDHNDVGTEHILIGLLLEGRSIAAQVLGVHGADLDHVRKQILLLRREHEPKAGAPPAEAQTKPLFRVLDEFGSNLTDAARASKFDPIIGREREMERIMQVLSRQFLTSPVLVGESGVGKTAILHGLAAKIASNQVPSAFADKELYAFDLADFTFTSTAKDREHRELGQILVEIWPTTNVVIFVDNMTLGTQDGSRAWSKLSPLLAHHELQIIGAAIPDEYAKLRLPGMDRMLVPIKVAEPTIEQTIAVLKGLRKSQETHHRITISDDALKVVALLANERLPDRSLPFKAIDLLDEAASLGAIRGLTKVDEALLTETVANMLGIPPETRTMGSPRFPPAAMTDDDRAIWGMA